MANKPKRRSGARPQAVKPTHDSESPNRPNSASSSSEHQSPARQSVLLSLPLMAIAGGLMAGVMVFANFHPSDSVAVENGDSIWVEFATFVAALVAAVAFAIAKTSCGSDAAIDSGSSSGKKRGVVPWSSFVQRIADTLPWLIAAWVSVAAWLTCPPGNVRLALNETWFWWAMAAAYFGCTVLMRSPSATAARRLILLLLVTTGVNQAVHAVQQDLIGLPDLRAEYAADPVGVLAKAGIAAPPGSAARMVFENRLNDGGPTGTFALANSLAAVLAMTIVGLIAITWRRFRDFGKFNLAAMVVIVVFCGYAILATNSRSAVGATVIGVMFVVVAGLVFRRTSKTNADVAAQPESSKTSGGLFGAGVAIGLSGLFAAVFAIGVVIFRRAEWLGQAVPSLQFRFQYWRSTLKLAADSPLAGAGPGNFRGAYEQYREASAHEQIAEPHNFLFETLGSGGFPAATLLAVLVALVAWMALIGLRPNRHAMRDKSTETIDFAADTSAVFTRWAMIGISVSVFLVCCFGPIVGASLDLSAQMYALPVAVACGVFFWPLITQASRQDLHFAASAVLLTVAIHLSVAGGWTVPGIALPVWALIAMVTAGSATQSDADVADVRAQRPSWSAFVPAAILGLGCAMFYVNTVLPVQTVSIAMLNATGYQSRGRIDRAEQSLVDAVNADRWAIEPAVQLEGFHRMMYLFSPPAAQSTSRKRWIETMDDVLRRGGRDPSITKLVATARLHAYQRFGRSEDLAAAENLLQDASRRSPSHEGIFAQYAAVCEATGQYALAHDLAQHAKSLSLAGGNIERDFSRLMILPPITVGENAASGPTTASAQELLGGLVAAE